MWQLSMSKSTGEPLIDKILLSVFNIWLFIALLYIYSLRVSAKNLVRSLYITRKKIGTLKNCDSAT